jgi:hypothetical protein
MKQVTLQIPDKKYPFFMELVKNLGFAKEVELEEDEPSKEEIINNLKRGFEEMQLIKQGKLKTTPLKDFLNEL